MTINFLETISRHPYKEGRTRIVRPASSMMQTTRPIILAVSIMMGGCGYAMASD